MNNTTFNQNMTQAELAALFQEMYTNLKPAKKQAKQAVISARTKEQMMKISKTMNKTIALLKYFFSVEFEQKMANKNGRLYKAATAMGF